MAETNAFKADVARLLGLHQDKPALVAQIKELLAQAEDDGVTTYWLRETEDLVNVVSLGRTFIGDVSWLPSSTMAQMITVRLSKIISMETRDAPSAAINSGLAVSGSMVVQTHVEGERGGLIWAATDDEGSKDTLRAFTMAVLKAIATS